jgi:GTP pyrophosphokinase
MDEVAERGIAAHWRYKGVHGDGRSNEEWLASLREMMEESDRKNIGTGKLSPTPASGEIFVFTPDGDLRKLPEGATVLDFAFDIHTGLGASCAGARIGERNVPIKETLRNGDIVNIQTSKNQKPKADWLGIVVTSKARNKIKAFLREEQMKMAKLGREELERKLKNWKLAITIDEAVGALCKYYKVKTGTELYARIADGKLAIGDTKELISRHIDGELFEAKTPPKQAVPTTAMPPKQEQGEGNDALIIGDSVGGLDYKPGKCCNPIFGDEVFGFVTISSGITIHRSDCPNARRLREQYPYRIIEARWRNTACQGSFLASLRIVAEDTTGMVNHITDTITNRLKINIRSMSLSPMSDNRIGGLVNVEVPNTQTLDMIAFHLLKIKGVEKAHRIDN